MILLGVVAAGCIVFCWLWGDLRPRTKLALTLLYAVCWTPLLVPIHRLWLFPLAQCLVILVVGGATFGLEWLMSSR